MSSASRDVLPQQEYCKMMDEMTQSILSVRELVKSLRDKQKETSDLDTRDGISLLSLKHHTMLSYIHSLVLLSSRQAVGHPMDERQSPSESYSSTKRGVRGSAAGDLVDALLENRVVLEKARTLEGKMKYQIEKLVRLAEEAPKAGANIADDPLAFRPNPQALMDAESDAEEADEDYKGDGGKDDGVYRPPKVAPMPYTESTGKGKDKKARRAPAPATLAALAHLDPARPHAESTSGLGGLTNSTAGDPEASRRARDVRRMTEFEEENFTRLVLKKSEERRRRRDEEDIALGGTPGMARSGRRRGGLEDEFGDILRSVGRPREGRIGDGYEELREKGKKEGVLGRARKRGDTVDDLDASEGEPMMRKRSRFDREVKAAKKRVNAKRR